MSIFNFGPLTSAVQANTNAVQTLTQEVQQINANPPAVDPAALDAAVQAAIAGAALASQADLDALKAELAADAAALP